VDWGLAGDVGVLEMGGSVGFDKGRLGGRVER